MKPKNKFEYDALMVVELSLTDPVQDQLVYEKQSSEHLITALTPVRRQKTLYRELSEVVYVVKRRNAQCLLESKEICLPQKQCFKQL